MATREELLRVGLVGVIEPALDRVLKGTDCDVAARETLARRPALTASASEWLIHRGLAAALCDVADEVRSYGEE